MVKSINRVFVILLAVMLQAVPARAQIVDPKVQQLEEQVRRLNGLVEELNFQMLQMQDQMRRMQEDNEFRLQQLEEQQQGALPGADDHGRAVADAGSDPVADNRVARLEPVPQSVPAPSSGVEIAPGPRTLGTLTLDATGQVTGSDIDFSTNAIERALDENSVASVTLTGGPEAVYEEGYRHVLNGDYAQAEAVFERFVSVYPSDALTADARFWLGESMLAQGRFEEALDVFIDTQAKHPDGSKGPETMLKIGTIMAALGDRDIACVTFQDAIERFGGMRPQTRSAIEGEYAKARC